MTTEDFDIMLDAFGETVTGTPAGTGTPAAFTAIVNTNFPNQEDHPQRGLRFAVATIDVSEDDWTIDDRDIFTFRGYNWEVDAEGWAESQLSSSSAKIYRGDLVRMIS